MEVPVGYEEDMRLLFYVRGPDSSAEDMRYLLNNILLDLRRGYVDPR